MSVPCVPFDNMYSEYQLGVNVPNREDMTARLGSLSVVHEIMRRWDKAWSVNESLSSAVTVKQSKMLINLP